MEEIAKRIETGGTDAWYSLDPKELIGADADDYVKVTDILDVWFDSGVTHFCVLDRRPNLARKPGDKVMYLEGSDQHRGWFHSSLLTSVAMHGHAPYDEVLTHGFTVDAQGRKMSKSLGNGIEPQDVMKNYGADILRLWIASADYRNEMALSDEILKRVADAYRRIRNTARFLLGNLHGFDPAKDLVAPKDSLLLDQWAIQQAYDTQQAVIAAYAKYDFPEIVQRIQNFCTNELGSLYLDITKDRLYTMQENSHGRRSAQSAMYRILEALVRWLAPILSFTAEEIWQVIPGERSESVMFETFYDGLEAVQGSPEQREAWSELLKIRAAVAKQLETMRAAGEIGASLEADVTLYADFLPFAALLSGNRKAGDGRVALLLHHVRPEGRRAVGETRRRHRTEDGADVVLDFRQAQRRSEMHSLLASAAGLRHRSVESGNLRTLRVEPSRQRRRNAAFLLMSERLQWRDNALVWLAVSALVIVFDQITKAVVIAKLEPYVPHEVIPGFFNWTLAFNTGAAFSFLADQPGWQRWLFTVLAIGVSIALTVWLKTTRRGDWKTALPVRW